MGLFGEDALYRWDLPIGAQSVFAKTTTTPYGWERLGSRRRCYFEPWQSPLWADEYHDARNGRGGGILAPNRQSGSDTLFFTGWWFLAKWLEGNQMARKQAETSCYANKFSFQIAKQAGEIARRNGATVGSAVPAFLCLDPFCVAPTIRCSMPTYLAIGIGAMGSVLSNAECRSLRKLTNNQKGCFGH
jgi:hypothetical protein